MSSQPKVLMVLTAGLAVACAVIVATMTDLGTVPKILISGGLVVVTAAVLIALYRLPLVQAREQDARVLDLHAEGQGIRNNIAAEIEKARELLLQAQNKCQSAGMAEPAVEIRKTSDALDALKRLAVQAEAGRIDRLKNQQVGMDKLEKIASFDRSIADSVRELTIRAGKVQSRVLSGQTDALGAELSPIAEMASELSRRFKDRQQIVQSL